MYERVESGGAYLNKYADYTSASTLSGKEGSISLSPTVGNVILEKFQEIGLSEGLNLKDSKRMDKTTSVKSSGTVSYAQLQQFTYSSPVERI